MRDEQVVPRPVAERFIAMPRGEFALCVADIRRDGLVDRRKIGNKVGIETEHLFRILAEPFDAVTVCPAALLFEALGKIPMIERDVWRNTCFQQSFKDALIVVDALFVELSRAFGKHPRPGKRHAVAVHAERFEVFKIARKEAVIAVARGRKIFGVHDLFFGGERIPDARAPAVFRRAALDLGGSRRNAP